MLALLVIVLKIVFVDSPYQWVFLWAEQLWKAAGLSGLNDFLSSKHNASIEINNPLCDINFYSVSVKCASIPINPKERKMYQWDNKEGSWISKVNLD